MVSITTFPSFETQTLRFICHFLPQWLKYPFGVKHCLFHIIVINFCVYTFRSPNLANFHTFGSHSFNYLTINVFAVIIMNSMSIHDAQSVLSFCAVGYHTLFQEVQFHPPSLLVKKWKIWVSTTTFFCIQDSEATSHRLMSV